jgi:hypothetical protein
MISDSGGASGGSPDEKQGTADKRNARGLPLKARKVLLIVALQDFLPFLDSIRLRPLSVFFRGLRLLKRQAITFGRIA